jgi:hypothetical protein
MKQFFFRLRPLVILSCLVLWACAPSEPPRAVVSTFWAATLTGNQPVIQALVIPGSLVTADFDAARHHEIFDGVILGETRHEDDRAMVETRLQGIFFGIPGEVHFDTVLAIHNGEWRVDYGATVSEMIGVLLGESVDEVNEQMYRDIDVIEEGMTESIRKDLQQPIM